jgi:DNA topoisomerase-1
VQAWGVDAKGRRQYRYHQRAVERGTLRKYYRVRQLALDLPAIRRRVHRDFHQPGLSKRKVAAGVVRLISQGFFRVGGERSAEENRTFGITTLRKSHVRVDGESIHFDYVGKARIRQHRVVVDRSLARFVRSMTRTPGGRLFRYRDDDGRWHDVTARDVNDYLRHDVGMPYTAKDFRTWGGTLRVATVLGDLGPAERERDAKRNATLACRLVAAELGNTPTICRQSYTHPILLAKYVDEGATIAGYLTRARARDCYAHAAEERALIRFLAEHFPDRRRRRRHA